MNQSNSIQTIIIIAILSILAGLGLLQFFAQNSFIQPPAVNPIPTINITGLPIGSITPVP
ncbi:hypothetical protein A3A93_05130 [Candidatus Roizmanbacteria bacterium RIFCSPLOWO2_01_FULL_38_12]|uniref:Uncharacterized protein n=1 Tax=Candidatus Roizmanbacteria bacterium RIFCSPLOWO2_01_FULL_38_12 TaxID=1802061 RepID=A0A1F7IQZ3_9BACT|nr:MAG: hypothetical protein A2861_03235 [Candidatus Roizmanbacteria bacterium RIFCSPHIGHO2_01_FULL_38_15]OGK35989.1 MAG: hypothetical protein A3F59_05405 [Candidatus Roizmanbacteria bacterium RIFCSPHIGHO2_12_FULL_38_13]OGK45774.1 MAG: hypothetical protein A3A93_05130 [Candidatus Roizmanbacteria bacterium RIFCSPLOWO2_01_FULL_38_12]